MSHVEMGQMCIWVVNWAYIALPVVMYKGLHLTSYYSSYLGTYPDNWDCRENLGSPEEMN